MIYEHKRHPVLPRAAFLRRAFRHVLWAGLVVASALAIGILGYHALGHLGWLDSFLNASMILGGMGPVDRMEDASAKVFAGAYALFSGLVFIGVVGVVLAPWLHRLFHLTHLEQ